VSLLVGSLALSYSLGAGHLAPCHVTSGRWGEVLLTAAQSLFGVAVLARLSFGPKDAALLADLFASQPVLGGVLRTGA
jgi:cation:H+ antiporter